MTTERKIKLLEKLLESKSDLQNRGSSDPVFKSWKSQVERTYIKVFGENSHELKEFQKLKFFYNPSFYFAGDDHTMQHKERYAKDLQLTLMNIENFVIEFKEELENEEPSSLDDEKGHEMTNDNVLKKVFISHASKDKDLVEEIIDILETIGLKTPQIFCSSFEGYGIELGEDFLERIKNELDNEVLVLFVLSENFYASPICLCEMGATWIKTNNHIPILIPPFGFKNIQGVIPLTQGFHLNDEMKLNSFKERIEKLFSLPNNNDFSTWERKRDRILKRINDKLKTTP